MPSAARGVIDQSVSHSAFRILPTVPQPTSADFIPQITFRIPHFRKLPTPRVLQGTPSEGVVFSLYFRHSIHSNQKQHTLMDSWWRRPTVYHY